MIGQPRTLTQRWLCLCMLAALLAYASAACTIDHSWFPTFPADNNGPRGYAAYTQAGVVIPESDIENNLYKFAIGSRIVPRCDSKRAAETRGYVCLHKSDSVTDYRWYTLDDFTETASSDLSNSDAYFSCYSPCGAITYNYPTQKAMFYEYSVTSSPYEITNSYAHGTVATLRCQSLIEDSTSFTNYGRLTCDDGEWVNHDSSVTITSGSSYMIDTEDTGCTYCNQTIAEMLEYVIEQGFLIPGAAGIQTDIVNANHWGVFRPTCMDETARALGTAQCKMGSWELNEVSSPSDIKCYPSECDAASIATNNAWSKVVTPDLNGVVSNVITPTYVCAPGTIPTPGTTLECEFSTSKFQWVDPNVACQAANPAICTIDVLGYFAFVRSDTTNPYIPVGYAKIPGVRFDSRIGVTVASAAARRLQWNGDEIMIANSGDTVSITCPAGFAPAVRDATITPSQLMYLPGVISGSAAPAVTGNMVCKDGQFYTAAGVAGVAAFPGSDNKDLVFSCVPSQNTCVAPRDVSLTLKQVLIDNDVSVDFLDTEPFTTAMTSGEIRNAVVPLVDGSGSSIVFTAKCGPEDGYEAGQFVVITFSATTTSLADGACNMNLLWSMTNGDLGYSNEYNVRPIVSVPFSSQSLFIRNSKMMAPEYTEVTFKCPSNTYLAKEVMNAAHFEIADGFSNYKCVAGEWNTRTNVVIDASSAAQYVCANVPTMRCSANDLRKAIEEQGSFPALGALSFRNASNGVLASEDELKTQTGVIYAYASCANGVNSNFYFQCTPTMSLDNLPPKWTVTAAGLNEAVVTSNPNGFCDDTAATCNLDRSDSDHYLLDAGVVFKDASNSIVNGSLAVGSVGVLECADASEYLYNTAVPTSAHAIPAYCSDAGEIVSNTVGFSGMSDIKAQLKCRKWCAAPTTDNASLTSAAKSKYYEGESIAMSCNAAYNFIPHHSLFDHYAAAETPVMNMFCEDGVWISEGDTPAGEFEWLTDGVNGRHGFYCVAGSCPSLDTALTAAGSVASDFVINSTGDKAWSTATIACAREYMDISDIDQARYECRPVHDRLLDASVGITFAWKRITDITTGAVAEVDKVTCSLRACASQIDTSAFAIGGAVQYFKHGGELLISPNASSMASVQCLVNKQTDSDPKFVMEEVMYYCNNDVDYKWTIADPSAPPCYDKPLTQFRCTEPYLTEVDKKEYNFTAANAVVFSSVNGANGGLPFEEAIITCRNPQTHYASGLQPATCRPRNPANLSEGYAWRLGFNDGDEYIQTCLPYANCDEYDDADILIETLNGQNELFSVSCTADHHILADDSLAVGTCVGKDTFRSAAGKLFTTDDVKCKHIFTATPARIVSGDTVVITFSHPVVIPPAHIQSQKCSDILSDKSVALLGTGAKCAMTDATTLTITLGDNFVLRLYSTITIQPSVINKFYFKGVSVPIPAAVVTSVVNAISPPDVTVRGTVSDAPSTCAGVTVDFSSSLGAAGLAMKYQYSLSAGATAQQIAYFTQYVAEKLPTRNASFRKLTSPQAVNKLVFTGAELAEFVPSGSVTINVAVTNWLNVTGTGSATFTVEDTNVPALFISADSVTVTSSNAIEVVANAKPSVCASETTTVLTASWSLVSKPAAVDADSITLPVAGASKLAFAAGALPVGAYVFRATAVQSDSASGYSVESSIDVDVTVLATELIPVIAGGATQVFNRALAANFVLDGSASFDAGLVAAGAAAAKAGLSYEWTCFLANNAPCQLAGNVTDVPVPTNVAVFSIPSSQVDVLDGLTVTIVLTVTKNGVSASASAAFSFSSASDIIVTNVVASSAIATASGLVQPDAADLVLTATVAAAVTYKSRWYCAAPFAVKSYAVAGAAVDSNTVTISKTAFGFANSGSLTCTFYASETELPTSATGLAAIAAQGSVTVTFAAAPAAAVCTGSKFASEYKFDCTVADAVHYVVTKQVNNAAVVVSDSAAGVFYTVLAAGTHQFTIVVTNPVGLTSTAQFTYMVGSSSASAPYLESQLSAAIAAGNGAMYLAAFTDLLGRANTTTLRAALLTSLEANSQLVAAADFGAAATAHQSTTLVALVKQLVDTPALTTATLRSDAAALVAAALSDLAKAGSLTKALGENAVAIFSSLSGAAVDDEDVSEITYLMQRFTTDFDYIVAALLANAPVGTTVSTTSGAVSLTVSRLSIADAQAALSKTRSPAVAVSADFFEALAAKGVAAIDVASSTLSNQAFLSRVGYQGEESAVSTVSGLKFYTVDGARIDTSAINEVLFTIKHAGGLKSENHEFPLCEFLLEDSVAEELTEANFWSTAGCEVDSHTEDLTVCKCTHLTHVRVVTGSAMFSADRWLTLNNKNFEDNMTPFYVVIVWIAAMLVFCGLVKIYDMSKKTKAAHKLALQWNTGRSPTTSALPEEASACDFVIRRAGLLIGDYHLLFSVFTRNVLDNVSSTPRMFTAMIVYLTAFCITAMFWGGKSSRSDLENYGGVIFLAALVVSIVAIIFKVLLNATHSKSAPKNFVYRYAYEVAKLYVTGSTSFFSPADQDRLSAQRNGANDAAYAQVVREYESENFAAAHAAARASLAIDADVLARSIKTHDVQTGVAAVVLYAFFLAWAVACSVLIIAFGIQLGNTVETTFGKWIGSAFATIGVEIILMKPVLLFLAALGSVCCSSNKADTLNGKRDRALTVVADGAYVMPVIKTAPAAAAHRDTAAEHHDETNGVAISVPEEHHDDEEAVAAYQEDEEVVEDVEPAFTAAPAAEEETETA